MIGDDLIAQARQTSRQLIPYLFEEGRPNGWVHATLQPGGARLELRCLDQSRKDHGQVVNLVWRS
jgi:hypothetical protein